MNEKYLLILLLGHFFCDFALQTNDQAQKKSTSFDWLCYHTLTYSAGMFLMVLLILPFEQALSFAFFTLFFHTLTDYITSRIGKPFWDKQDYHNGFVVIGFDQILHYLQLYFTVKLLL